MSGEKAIVRVKRDIKQALGLLGFIWQTICLYYAVNQSGM